MALMFRSVLQNDGGAAELIVTCDSEFAGATISCSDGTTTLNKTCPSSSPYEVTFKIPNSGDWTISATVSGTAYTSDPISVELDYTALLEYGFNWRRWVDTTQFLDSTDYNSLDEVLADEEAVRELCLEHACVDYLADIATANEDVETIINNDLFAKWVNNSDYSLDVLGANVAIKALMDTADKYGYGEWSLMPQVPTMTSNTAPYGEVIFSDIYGSGYEAYKAFDGVATTRWNGQNSVSNNYIGYHFTSPICIKSVYIDAYGTGNSKIALGGYKIQGSNDNFVSDIHDLYTGNTTGVTWQEHIPITVNLDNSASYEYYRLYSLGNPIDTALDSVSIWTIQFYAWQPKGNVPVMTSNSAPYGEASGTNVRSGYEAYKAFNNDYSANFESNNTTTADLIYKFTNPVCVKRALVHAAGGRTLTATVSISNDGTNYTPISEAISDITISGKTINCTNDTFALYVKLSLSVASGNVGVAIAQFYGRELSVSVPTMTGNTTPYGEAFGSTPLSTNVDCWKAFNGSNDGENSTWASNFISGEDYIGYIGYTSTSKIVPKMVVVKNRVFNDDNCRVHTFKIQGSDTGNSNDWHDITDVIDRGTAANASGYGTVHIINGTTPYKMLRMLILSDFSQYSITGVAILQFYGLDYSEKEFEEGTTKKWLYDHGVELETISGGGTVTVEKRDSDIKINDDTTSAYGIVSTPSINLANYNVVRAKFGLEMTVSSSSFIRVGNAIASTAIQANQLPNNNGLDISSVSDTDKVYIAPANTGGTGLLTLTEFWLE